MLPQGKLRASYFGASSLPDKVAITLTESADAEFSSIAYKTAFQDGTKLYKVTELVCSMSIVDTGRDHPSSIQHCADANCCIFVRYILLSCLRALCISVEVGVIILQFYFIDFHFRCLMLTTCIFNCSS